MMPEIDIALGSFALHMWVLFAENLAYRILALATGGKSCSSLDLRWEYVVCGVGSISHNILLAGSIGI